MNNGFLTLYKVYMIVAVLWYFPIHFFHVKFAPNRNTEHMKKAMQLVDRLCHFAGKRAQYTLYPPSLLMDYHLFYT